MASSSTPFRITRHPTDATAASLFQRRIVNKEMEERVPKEVCENVRRRARKTDRKENRTDDKIRKREII